MKDLLLRALDTARLRGASYADARFVDEERQTVLVKDGRVEAVTSDRSRGIGVRVIANGGWGFAASSRLGARDIDMTAAAAVRTAKASSTALRAPVDIGEPAPVTASYATPVRREPVRRRPFREGGAADTGVGRDAPRQGGRGSVGVDGGRAHPEALRQHGGELY